jgi:integrase
MSHIKGSVYKSGKNYKFFVLFNNQKEWFYSDPCYHDPFDTKQKAEIWFDRARDEIAGGVFNPTAWRKGSPVTISSFSSEWLNIIKTKVKDNTYRGYRSSVNNYILPFCKDHKIKDIRFVRKMDIDKFKLYMQERCSPKGVYHKMSVFKQILNEAYYNGYLQKKIHFPRLENPMGEIEYLEREDQEIILSAIPQEHKPIFIFMMEYGCRPSEARALMKDCIRNSRVTIKRAFSDDMLYESTKTGSKGVRTFDITPRFRDVLNTMPKTLSPFVFTRPDGDFYHYKDLPKIWKKAQQKTGLNIKMYNAFRHSLGCQLLNEGVPDGAVQQILGHTDKRTTDRYAKRNSYVLTQYLINRGKVVEFKKGER